jgi:hypothetical protein
LTFHLRVLAILCAPPWGKTKQEALSFDREWIFNILLASRDEDGQLIIKERISQFEYWRKLAIGRGMSLDMAWKWAEEAAANEGG